MDWTGGAWNFVAGGAVLGAVAGMWDKIKAVLWRGLNLLVQRVELPSYYAQEVLVGHLVEKYARSRNYDRMYGAAWEHHRDGKYGMVPYEQFGQRSLIFWNGWFPFLYSNPTEKKGAAPGATTTRVQGTLMFLRGTLDVEAVLREACARRTEATWAAEDNGDAAERRFVIHQIPKRSELAADDPDRDSANSLPWYRRGAYRLLAHEPGQLGKPPVGGGRAIDNLVFPARVRSLLREVELWRKSRDWYRERGIPWKRGWLLYGPPGTGKTALARAFAEDLDLPIYVYNLAELTNAELLKAWEDMQANVPCIALIEDVDNVFHGRENVAHRHYHPAGLTVGAPGNPGAVTTPRQPLSFDCLLNCLDGVGRADGVFTVVTTNDVGKIDPALGQPRPGESGAGFISTRPGRIDKAIELGPMDAADKKRMARRILGEYERECLEMLEFVDRHPELVETPAQFQERCAQAALACFWREKAEAPAEVAEVAAGR